MHGAGRTGLVVAVLALVLLGAVPLPAGVAGSRTAASPPLGTRGLGGPAPDSASPRASAHPWSPASGKSSPGLPDFRLSTISRASSSCPQYVTNPAWLAYDPANGTFWVAAPASCVDLITPAATGSGYNLTDALAVGSSPFGVAVDNRTNDVFVTNSGSDNVTVISATNDTVVGSVAVGTNPHGVAFDWASDEVYVANTGSANVSVISATTFSVVATVPVGGFPIGVAADPADHHVYVANFASSNVSVIVDSTNSAWGSVATGNGSYGAMWDPHSDEVFVTNEGSNNISVLNGSSDALVATIAVPGTYNLALQGLTYDNATDQVWIGGGWSFAVVLNATAHTVTGYAGTDPSGAAFDPSNGDVCLTNTANDTFECLAPSPYRALNATTVELQEQGLPNGTAWTGELNESGANATWQTTTADNISFGTNGIVPGPYTYVVPATHGYVALRPQGSTNPPYYGNSTVDRINVSFVPASGAFQVTFAETGLPAGTLWSLHVGSSSYETSSSVDTVWLTNGTYNYTIAPTLGYDPSPPSGTVTVNGSNLNISVAFSNPSLYPISFAESGLGPGTTWWVEVSGHPTGGGFLTEGTTGSGSSLGLNVSNGTYSYTAAATGYTFTNASPNFVVNGSGFTVTVPFTYVGTTLFNVTFHESGLAAGHPWYGYLSGATNTSTGRDLGFRVLNGTYDFVVWADGYVDHPRSGHLSVNGSDVHVSISFTIAPYTVDFVESGLAAGQVWAVTLAGVVGSGFGSVPFSETNGTFAYQVAPAGGLYPVPPNGNVTVSGSNVTVPIVFGAYEYPVAATETGLPRGTSWSVELGGVARSSTASTITFDEPNGTYNVSVGAEPGYSVTAGATVSVAGAPTSFAVRFAADIFALSFVESGLPTGTGWGILIGSEVESGLTGNLTFEEPNGTYGYVVLAVPGYVTTSSGTVSVAGKDVTVNVTFHPETFPIVFVEFGLPAGSNWSVTVANNSTGFHQTLSSTSNAITFFLPNGTYSVTFTLPAGYSANATSTQVTVAGHGATGATVTIVPPATSKPRLVPTVFWLAVAGAALFAAVVAILVLVWARRRPKAPPPRAGPR